MGRWAKLLLTLLCAWHASSARASTSTHSLSGQFIVRSEADRVLPFVLATNITLLRPDATLVSVSAERIKRALGLQIGDLNPWRSKIIIDVFPASTDNDQIVVTSERFTDNWQYRVEIPSAISRLRFVRTILHVLLLEYANRHPGPYPAEIPFWLVEGLTWRLLDIAEFELVVDAPEDMRAVTPFNLIHREARRDPPLDAARRLFAGETPLSFEQLSWPGLNIQEGMPDEVYSRSAQLLMARLLQVARGGRGLRHMLELLPQHANWQFAFLPAFGFDRPLQVEKWWALQVAHFTSRTPDDSWDLATSLRKLDSVLVTPVQVYQETNGLPQNADQPLPLVLRTWDPEPAREILELKTRDLALLRLRIAPRLLPLLDQYIATLERIQERFPRKKNPKFAEAAALRIEALDKMRNNAEQPGP